MMKWIKNLLTPGRQYKSHLLHAENVIRSAEEKYRSFFNNSMDAVLITAPDGRIFEANESACKMFGMSADELIGAGRSGLVDSDDARLQILLTEREKYGHARGELTYIRKDGSKFTGEATSAIFKDNKGNLRTSMIIRDVTDKERSRQELRESEERFRSLFYNNLSVMLIVDPDTGNITDANESAVKYYGWDYKKLTSMNLKDINILGEKIVAELSKARQSSQIYFEFRHKLADGSIRDIEAFVSRITISGKDYLHSIIHDITDRKEAEMKLQEQLDELRRWHEVTLGREERIIELKRQVNELLEKAGRPVRYPDIQPGQLS